jgi:cytochrome d ubiquinol oxidase subunit I
LDRLSHVIPGAWLAGTFLVLSVSAYYLIRNKTTDVAQAGMRIGLVVALIASCMQLLSGHESAQEVARYQPSKLAAMEGHFVSTGPADLHLFGWVDEHNAKTLGLAIPGGLGFLISGDFKQQVKGLDAIPHDERPPINITFQFFHIMVLIGMLLIAISVTGSWMAWKGTLWHSKPMLWVFVISVLLPELANQLGWWTAEVGRQPWIVYGLLKTAQGTSPVVASQSILISIGMFSIIYILLFALFIYLLNAKIHKGPGLITDSSVDHDPRLTVQSKEGGLNAY